jgi:hypothetical protein
VQKTHMRMVRAETEKLGKKSELESRILERELLKSNVR